MDYPNRHRVKIWATAEFVENDPELLRQVTDADYKARPERVLLFHVNAWDVNCTQHIKQRFTVDEMAPKVKKLQQCIADLEKTNASLRRQLGEAARALAVAEPSSQLIASLLTEKPPGEKGCGID